MSHAARAHEQWTARIGDDPGPGDWLVIDQERVDAFADATLDHQFIHVDPVKAADTPFGGTIAHGFLTLSLVVHLMASIPDPHGMPEGRSMGVNYGLNKVRFLSPVPVGSRIRARAVISEVVLKGASVDVTRTITIEIDGADKPALVAELIIRSVFVD